MAQETIFLRKPLSRRALSAAILIGLVTLIATAIDVATHVPAQSNANPIGLTKYWGTDPSQEGWTAVGTTYRNTRVSFQMLELLSKEPVAVLTYVEGHDDQIMKIQEGQEVLILNEDGTKESLLLWNDSIWFKK